MARKSRKKSPEKQIEVQQAIPAVVDNTKLPTAAYVRLSGENNGYETDDSIKTQIQLIHNFLKDKNDLELVDTYVDNGFSGMSFDRPEFDRLMADVRAGRIQCIVVKDLSRFGRDYLETGYYMESVFPYLHVRFIAVTDDFDNSREEDMDSLAVPIKNIVNSMYAKDISKKLASVNKIKRMQGAMPLGFPLYGFSHDANRTTMLVDEDTACYVRLIYQWRLLGLPIEKIVDRLNFLEAPSPRKVQQSKSGKTTAGGSGKWGTTTVNRILSNQTYVGDYVIGKTTSAMYKGEALHNVPEEDWTIHHNTHDPIILRSDFEAVREKREETRKRFAERKAQPDNNISEVPNVFRNIVFCASCGRPMTFSKNTHCNEKDVYMIAKCSSKKGTTLCRDHNIKEKLLRILVMDQIHLLIKATCDRAEMVKNLMNAKDEGNKVISLRRKAASLDGQIAKMEERKMSLYEDYADGVLDAEEYQYMKEHYILEKQKLEKNQNDILQSLYRLEKRANNLEELARHLEQYIDDREYNEELVRELVEAIYVGTDNSIEVRFKCADPYEEWRACWEMMNDGE